MSTTSTRTMRGPGPPGRRSLPSWPVPGACRSTWWTTSKATAGRSPRPAPPWNDARPPADGDASHDRTKGGIKERSYSVASDSRDVELAGISAGQKALSLAFAGSAQEAITSGALRCAGPGRAATGLAGSGYRDIAGTGSSRRGGTGLLPASNPDARGHAGRAAWEPTALAFRFLVAVDVEGFSRRPAAEQAKAQNDLEYAMSVAARWANLDRPSWYRQPRGDGELAVLPPDANGLTLVADFPRCLVSTLNEVNRSTAPGSR